MINASKLRRHGTDDRVGNCASLVLGELDFKEGRTKASDTCDVDHTFCVKGLKAGLLLKLIPHMILTQSLFSGNMDVRCWMWKFVG